MDRDRLTVEHDAVGHQSHTERGAQAMDDSRFSMHVAELQGRLAELQTREDPVPIELLLQDLQTAVEELQVADEEVRTQQAEVTRLLEDQQLTRWRHDRIMASLPVAVLTTDHNGRLRSINPAAGAMLGIPLTSLLSKPLFTFVEPGHRGGLRSALAEVVREGVPRTLPMTLRLRGLALAVSASLSVAPQVTDDVTWILLPEPEGLEEEQEGEEEEGSGLLSLPTALARLFVAAAGGEGQHDVLQRTAYIVAETLGADTALSLTLGPPTTPVAVASSTVTAQTLDGWQLESGQGPSVLAVRSRETVVSRDLRHDPRWPAPPAAHDDARLVGVVAVPLHRGEELDGVLTTYLPADRAITPRLVEQIEVLAASIGAVLQELGLRTHLEGLAADMQSALASRSVIEQAKGIVMAAKHCSADEAFQHLVSLSNTSHLKLRDVARHVVDGVGG